MHNFKRTPVIFMIQQINSFLIKGVFLFVCASITLSCASSKTSGTDDQFLTGSVVSCSHLNIYQLSTDNKSYIQVIINSKKIELKQENSWDLAENNPNVTVRMREFEQDIASALCSDIGGKKSKPQAEYSAAGGKLILVMSDVDWQNYQKGMRYKVDLNATTIKLKEDKTYGLNITQASVGWMPG
ncbi:MAG: hypothetical protein ABJF11_06410 [Reichenbachiella sp.]|uniref:hypothetical protein n=1 Tax=Reichenbachiella sp. TaxID=2184521 RepID=UPI003266319B